MAGGMLDTAGFQLSYCRFVRRPGDLLTAESLTKNKICTSENPTEKAWAAIRGGYDLQVHVAPDVIERRIDDLDLAKEFLARGLNGFVLKSHYFPTAERAKVVTKAVPGIRAMGAITLNHAVGGLNPVALELAGRSGCKVVWMPTVDAANETAGRPDGTKKHLPFWAKIQLERVLVTHAEFPSQSLTAQEQVDLADLGATIEHCFTTMHTGKAPWAEVIDSIRKVGTERCLLSTDLGQTINPPVAEGFAMFAQTLLDAGFSAAEIHRMVATNAEALID
jgi:hypothetical protein